MRREGWAGDLKEQTKHIQNKLASPWACTSGCNCWKVESIRECLVGDSEKVGGIF